MLGSLGIVVYRTQLAHTIPAGISASAVHTARESLTAALAASQHLPGRLGADLVAGARAAFTSGLNAVAWVGTVAFVGLSILAAVALRRAGEAPG